MKRKILTLAIAMTLGIIPGRAEFLQIDLSIFGMD